MLHVGRSPTDCRLWNKADDSAAVLTTKLKLRPTYLDADVLAASLNWKSFLLWFTG